MGSQLVMDRMASRVDVTDARCVRTDQVPLFRDHERLIQGGPPRDPVAEAGRDHRGVLAEPSAESRLDHPPRRCRADG